MHQLRTREWSTVLVQPFCEAGYPVLENAQIPFAIYLHLQQEEKSKCLLLESESGKNDGGPLCGKLTTETKKLLPLIDLPSRTTLSTARPSALASATSKARPIVLFESCFGSAKTCPFAGVWSVSTEGFGICECPATWQRKLLAASLLRWVIRLICYDADSQAPVHFEGMRGIPPARTLTRSFGSMFEPRVCDPTWKRRCLGNPKRDVSLILSRLSPVSTGFFKFCRVYGIFRQHLRCLAQLRLE